MGMFGDRSRKVVSNQNDLQAMELDLFRMQMQKIAREDAQKMAIIRESLGITESLRTPQQVTENIQRAQGRGDTTTMVDVTGTPQGQLSNPEPLFEMARQIRQPEIQEDELPLISIGDATVVESQSAPEMPMPSSPTPAVETQTEAPAATTTSATQEDTGLPSNIDFGFIGEQEGQRSAMYIPRDSQGNAEGSSGPTIGTGVDLGQRTAAELEGLPQALRTKLEPYTNMKGADAIEFVEQNPLTLTAEEVSTLNGWAKKQETDSLIKLWERDSDIAWEDLTTEQATAVASVMYQYGSKKVRTPKFWEAATSGDWATAEAELRNFGDRYPSRRTREADYLAGN